MRNETYLLLKIRKSVFRNQGVIIQELEVRSQESEIRDREIANIFLQPAISHSSLLI